jgi:hypothetical protein
MASCSLYDKYQGFGGFCSIHLHIGRPENARSSETSVSLQHIPAYLPHHTSRSSGIHGSLLRYEWVSSHPPKISWAHTLNYVTITTCTSFSISPVTRRKQLTESLNTPKYRPLIFRPWKPSQTDARHTLRCVLWDYRSVVMKNEKCYWTWRRVGW